MLLYKHSTILKGLRSQITADQFHSKWRIREALDAPSALKLDQKVVANHRSEMPAADSLNLPFSPGKIGTVLTMKFVVLVETA